MLTYALYPTTGMRFLRIKHGLDPVPDEMKPPVPDGVSDEARPVGGPAGTPVDEHPERSANTRRFNVFVGDEYFEVDVDPVDPLRPTVTGPQAAASRPRTARSPDTLSPGEHAVSAPMPGVLLRYEVEAGQAVEEGDPIAVLEGNEDGEHPAVAGGRDRQSPPVGTGRHGQAGSGTGHHIPVIVLVRRHRCWGPDGAAPVLGMS